VPENFDRKLNW